MRIASYLSVFSYAIILFTACSKGGGSSPAETLPAASINSVSQDRALTTTNFHFTVSLDKAATADATIHYATLPATAEENTDYTPVSGTLNIAAGQKQASFDVAVTGDSTRKENQFFYVQLSDPKNCKLGALAKGSGNILNENGLYFPVDNTGYSTPNKLSRLHTYME
jgi:hypothetical protein